MRLDLCQEQYTAYSKSCNSQCHTKRFRKETDKIIIWEKDFLPTIQAFQRYFLPFSSNTVENPRQISQSIMCIVWKIKRFVAMNFYLWIVVSAFCSTFVVVRFYTIRFMFHFVSLLNEIRPKVPYNFDRQAFGKTKLHAARICRRFLAIMGSLTLFSALGCFKTRWNVFGNFYCFQGKIYEILQHRSKIILMSWKRI